MTRDERQIRLFVSSTFLDMQPEREALVKRTFPRIRDICEQRGLTFHEVDLRWGITEEASKNNQVIPICLDEIDSCRIGNQRLFIGIIGKRYGTLIEDISTQQDLPLTDFLKTIDQKYYELVKQYCNASITELEIQYGLLQQPDRPTCAFFYLFDPLPPRPVALPATEAHAESDQPAQEQALSNQPNNEDVGTAQQAYDHLVKLRTTIKQSGYPVRTYRDPTELSKRVLDDLRDLIDEHFAVEQPPGQAEREDEAHTFFAEHLSRIYCGRQRLFDRLDTFVAGSSQPLAVVGPAGAGKSALLASWCRQRLGQVSPPLALSQSPFDHVRRVLRRMHPPNNPLLPHAVIIHFVGATAESTNWAHIVRRITTTLKERFHLPLDLPMNPRTLRTALTNWFHAVAQHGRLVVVIDGLDRLDDREQALDLGWLPETIPAHVRLLLSTSGGSTLTEIRRRGWSTLAMPLLNQSERRRFTTAYLKQYGKKLDATHLKPIITAHQTTNPLYLRVVLEELRVFGYHEDLLARVKHYVEATDSRQLFERVLIRLEADYEHDRPALVGDSLQLIWAARRGMGEAELRDLLGQPNAPLPPAIWSPLYLAMKEMLLNQEGILRFAYDALRTTVQEQYLSTDEQRRAAHTRLAHYFAARPMTRRVIEELPWHLAALGAWLDLATLLARPDYIAAAWPGHQLEVRTYWTLVEQHSPYRMDLAYAPLMSVPNLDIPTIAPAICALLGDTGHTRLALELATVLEQHARQMQNPTVLQAAFSDQARFQARLGDFDAALTLLHQQEQICREFQIEAALAACLGNQGAVFMQQGMYMQALERFQAEAVICEQIGDLVGLGTCLGNQAATMFEQDNLTLALALLIKQERICRQIGDLRSLHQSLMRQGRIHHQREEKIPLVRKRYAEAESVFRRLGDWEKLQECLGFHALLQRDLGDYDQALDLLDEKARLCQQLDTHAAAIETLMQRADIYGRSLKQVDIATEILQQAYQLAQQQHLPALARKIVNWQVLHTDPQ